MTQPGLRRFSPDLMAEQLAAGEKLILFITKWE